MSTAQSPNPPEQAADDAPAWPTIEVDDESAGDVSAAPSDRFDSGRLTRWLRPAASQLEKAQASERLFWLRVVALVSLFGGVAAAGIVRVKHTTAGVRVSYELVKTSDELRVQLEENRRVEAILTGLKNPNALRREASDKFIMHTPSAGELSEVE